MQCIFGALFLGLGCNIFLVLCLWCYALSAISRRLATSVAHLLYVITSNTEKAQTVIWFASGVPYNKICLSTSEWFWQKITWPLDPLAPLVFFFKIPTFSCFFSLGPFLTQDLFYRTNANQDNEILWYHTTYYALPHNLTISQSFFAFINIWLRIWLHQCCQMSSIAKKEETNKINDSNYTNGYSRWF